MVIQEDEADDLLETVDRGLKQLRYGALSLLEVEADMPRRVLNILVENFEVDEDVVVRTADRMGFGDWHALTKLHRPQLKDTRRSRRARCGRPTTPRRSSTRSATRTSWSTTRSTRSRRSSRSCAPRSTIRRSSRSR